MKIKSRFYAALIYSQHFHAVRKEAREGQNKIYFYFYYERFFCAVESISLIRFS